MSLVSKHAKINECTIRIIGSDGQQVNSQSLQTKMLEKSYGKMDQWSAQEMTGLSEVERSVVACLRTML